MTAVDLTVNSTAANYINVIDPTNPTVTMNTTEEITTTSATNNTTATVTAYSTMTKNSITTMYPTVAHMKLFPATYPDTYFTSFLTLSPRLLP